MANLEGSATPPRRRRSHAERTASRRVDLVDGAIRSVAAHGLEATTVQTIARSAGASRGLIAHHFGGKDALLVAAYRDLCDRVSAAQLAAARASAGSAEARLEAIVEVAFSPPVFDPIHRAAFLAFWNAARTHAGMAAIHRELYAGYRTEVGRLFARAADDRGVRIDASAAAIGLIALLDGLWVELTIEPDGFAPEVAVAVCSAYVRSTLAEGTPA